MPRLLRSLDRDNPSISSPFDWNPPDYPPIINKTQFVREYQKGTFGNRSPTWDSYAEWRLVYGET